MGGRRFEFSKGTSNRFWDIDLSGSSFTVRWGKIGTDGQRQIKKFPSSDKARIEHEKLVAEKLKKGYVEVARTRATEDSRPAAPRWISPARGAQVVAPFEASWEPGDARKVSSYTLRSVAASRPA